MKSSYWSLEKAQMTLRWLKTRYAVLCNQKWDPTS